MPDNEIYSVSRLNREAKLLLGSHFPSIQVEGEISNLATPSSGHIYFTLKDNDAQVRCAMFRSRRKNLCFSPENGNHVLIKAEVSLFEQRGDYQLIVSKMEEVGDGLLRRKFEELMRKLSDEGLFSQDHKKPLPSHPKTIGIITSPSGAAIHDLLTVFKRRAPTIQINIYPTAVQGAEAASDIRQAVITADRRKECDLLILARGGGSIEDLSPFNDEKLARTIFQCKTPIVSSIGHETDFTIADFVADTRAATPSVAAETTCPDANEITAQFKRCQLALIQLINSVLLAHKQSSTWLSGRLLQQHPGHQLAEKAQRLDNLELRAIRTMQHNFERCQSRLESRQMLLQRYNPQQKLAILLVRQKQLVQRLNNAIAVQTEQKKQTLAETVRTLEAISPLSTLARGYAIVSNIGDNQVLKSSHETDIGNLIEARLAKGRLVCQVKKIHHA